MVGTAWINSQVQIKNELRHHIVISKVQIKDYFKSYF
jgi:hypothetical protein